MGFEFYPELGAFRDEVRSFFENDYPQDLIARVKAGVILSRQDQVRNQQALQSRGWLAISWPREYGGPGWDAAHRHVFEEEADRAGAPAIVPMAVLYVGPVIYTFGNEEQKRRWLPSILDSTEFWGQGYGEPEAGSDLASLRMTAERDGDNYVLNGSKIWTSYGHWADWIFCLARTSREERKQDGISFLCAEMSSPGISVHPIISLDGIHHLNRVDFDNVRVPVSQRIGDEGKGWHYATFLLQGERLSYAHIARKREDMKLLRQLASRLPGDDGQPLIHSPVLAAKLAACEIEVETLGISLMRTLSAGEAASPAQVSALKIAATQSAQRISELFVELAGPQGAVFAERHGEGWQAAMPLVEPFAPPAMAAYLFERAQTIYGGATEVQKNIIWRMLDRQ
ncbi:MAG: acyl-CoA dehydrogenase [Blastomonas sp. CACIA14H2]|uniref:acyl-CoA dehydrogenase family protein n=1 Tax=Blastomonas sp. CACIA14H2 TaxID=1419876 RepID=UPI0003D038B5|nr:MAG: acyl-CoA dehydrogenase [Blastomonas sp. CACIA14H2]